MSDSMRYKDPYNGTRYLCLKFTVDKSVGYVSALC